MELKNRILSIFAVFAFCVAATSAWAGQSTLNSDGARVRMPQSGTDTLSIGSGVHSFEISRCSEECDDAVLVLKAPTGLRIQLGPLFGELLNNPLQAYDGADINAPLLFSRMVDAQFPGVSVDASYGRFVSSGEYMKVVYKKGESDFFTLNAIVVNPNETHSVALCSDVHYNDDHCTSGSNNGGVVSSEVNSATVNTQVSLNATPNTGKWLNRVHAWDKFGSIAVTGGTWYTSNDATFTMPATSVWYEAFYATGLTAEDGLTIEKPKNEILEVDIPDNVKSFKINGWVDLSCSSMAPGKPLILRAPEGKHLQVLDSDGKPHDRGAFYRGQSVPYDGVYDDPVAAGAATLVGSVSYSNVLTLIDYPASASDDVRTIVRLMDESEVNNSPHSITVINRGDCKGSVSSGDLNLESVVVGTSVSMTVNPDEGCALNDVYVTIRSENDTARVPMTGGSWFAGNDFSFTMPFEDVYVVVNYAEKTNFTVSNDIHIDMPERGTLSASIPDYVSSFYIKDPKMQYDGVLVLTAPEDYKILLYGYVERWGESFLNIYDGANINATPLSSNPKGSVEVESSGNMMTLYLKGNPIFDNLTVEMIPVQKYKIHIHDVVNGTVVSSHSTAKAGDIVTLSYTPNNGYLLRSVDVWYNGTYFDVTGGKWYNNDAQFTMPASDVYVSSEFCYTYNCDLEIVMPQTGTESANIPKDIEFYISSMGSGYYAYSNNSDGTLTLTAPEGYVFNFEVWIHLNDAGDYLEIYDGANVNANKLLTASFVDNEWHELGEMFSSSRYLTLRFKSNETGIGEGLELYAKAVKLPDLALEIPRSSSSSVVLDNDVSYVQIQNKKDVEGHYFNNSDGSLTLTAPEGYGLSVNVTMFDVDNGKPCPDDIEDSLFVFDGTDVNSTLLASISKGMYYFYDYSVGRSLTFRFVSGNCLSGSGITLDVNVVKNEGSSAVAIYEDENWGKLAFIDGQYTGTDAISIPEPVEVDFIQINREFTAGVPSTIVLPFTLPQGTDLNGAKFYYLKNVVQNGTTWRATMKWIGEGNLPQANTPYSVICQGESLEFNMNHQKAVLQTTELSPVAAAETDNWLFVGVYAYKTWQESDNDEEIRDGLAYAITGHNANGVPKGTFAKVSSGVNANPMRAYMRKKDKTVQLQPVAQSIRASGASYGLNNISPEIIEVEFVDDEKTTAIGRMNTITGEIKIDRWYDLKGRRVNNVKRAAKGAYYGKRL